MNKCCICNIKFEGYGNNPYPIKDEGVCCFWCNLKYVIPARLRKLKEREKDNGISKNKP